MPELFMIIPFIMGVGFNWTKEGRKPTIQNIDDNVIFVRYSPMIKMSLAEVLFDSRLPRVGSGYPDGRVKTTKVVPVRGAKNAFIVTYTLY